MSEKSYQDRDVLDKLSVCDGHVVTFANSIEKVDASLPQRIVERTNHPPMMVAEDEAVDMVFAVVDEKTDVIALLQKWQQRIKPKGCIWLLTVKRGLPGYVDQRELIFAGKQTRVVDNKVCAVSSTVSAMRFVIRKAER